MLHIIQQIQDAFCFLIFSLDSTGSDVENAPSKVSDSGVGGLGSDEESWISDSEANEVSKKHL